MTTPPADRLSRLPVEVTDDTSMETIGRFYHRTYHGIEPWETCPHDHCPRFRHGLVALRAAVRHAEAHDER